MHTNEPMVADSCAFKVEIAVANFKLYKSPGSDQIPAELIQAEGMSSLILSGIGKNCLISGWSLLLYQFTKKGE
jgi:hypothetical protein